MTQRRALQGCILLAGCVPVFAGLSRLGAVLFVVPLTAPDVFTLVMELLVTPSLFLWQRHLAKTYSIE